MSKTCNIPCSECSRRASCPYKGKDETWPLGKITDFINDVNERLRRNEITEEYAKTLINGASSLSDQTDLVHINAVISEKPFTPTSEELFRLKKRLLEGELE